MRKTDFLNTSDFVVQAIKHGIDTHPEAYCNCSSTAWITDDGDVIADQDCTDCEPLLNSLEVLFNPSGSGPTICTWSGESLICSDVPAQVDTIFVELSISDTTILLEYFLGGELIASYSAPLPAECDQQHLLTEDFTPSNTVCTWPTQLSIIPNEAPASLKLDTSTVNPKNIVYYEWVEANQKWGKLNEDSPDPPQNLPSGIMDGQIIEVVNGISI